MPSPIIQLAARTEGMKNCMIRSLFVDFPHKTTHTVYQKSSGQGFKSPQQANQAAIKTQKFLQNKPAASKDASKNSLPMDITSPRPTALTLGNAQNTTKKTGTTQMHTIWDPSKLSFATAASSRSNYFMMTTNTNTKKSILDLVTFSPNPTSLMIPAQVDVCTWLACFISLCFFVSLK